MGQEEIIRFFSIKRLSGDDSFFSIREVAKGVNGGSKNYSAVRLSLYGLFKVGIVEKKLEGDLFQSEQVFRILEKHIIKE